MAATNAALCFDFALAADIPLQRIKKRGPGRKNRGPPKRSPLDRWCLRREHWSSTMMRDELSNHSAAGLSQAVHGGVAILLVSILPR